MKGRILSTFISFIINLAIGTMLLSSAFKRWRYQQYVYEMTIIEALGYLAIFLILGYLLYFIAEAAFPGIKGNIILKIITGALCCAVPLGLLKRYSYGINLRDPFEIAELIIFVLSGILIPVLTNVITNKKKMQVE